MACAAFCQNDAHIYCRYDQAKEEFINVMLLHARYYDLMESKNTTCGSRSPTPQTRKYIDEPENG